MEERNPITWLLSVATIIDENETKKAGLGLIFVGIIAIIISIILCIRDWGYLNINSLSLFCIGILIIVFGVILKRGYYR